MQTHRVKFKVSLSSGETYYEGKSPFENIPGQLSPWQRLIAYTVTHKCLITSLSLYTEDGHVYNLPSAGKNPRFHLFRENKKPIDYNYFHSVATETNVTQEYGIDKKSQKVADWYAVIEAVYPDHKLQIWVDELNPKSCWALII